MRIRRSVFGCCLPKKETPPFPNHPFKVIDDDKMNDMVESIKEYGVLVPIIVRPVENGNYEIVWGHRRHHAAVLAGQEEIPAIVREMGRGCRRSGNGGQ